MPQWSCASFHISWADQDRTLRGIIEESRVPKTSIVEVGRGLRPKDTTRPWDIVVLDFAAEGRNLIFDGAVTTIYRNSIMSRVADVPGYAAKLAEDKKFKAESDFLTPLSSTHGGRHTLVAFAMEDG